MNVEGEFTSQYQINNGLIALPLSVVLLLNISPSVHPVIEEIHKGALHALQSLKPEDEVALMVFAGVTELIQDFTKDRQLILDKIWDAVRGASAT